MQKTKQKTGKKIKYSNNKYFVVSRNKKVPPTGYPRPEYD